MEDEQGELEREVEVEEEEGGRWSWFMYLAQGDAPGVQAQRPEV